MAHHGPSWPPTNQLNPQNDSLKPWENHWKVVNSLKKVLKTSKLDVHGIFHQLLRSISKDFLTGSWTTSIVFFSSYWPHQVSEAGNFNKSVGIVGALLFFEAPERL
jgi:hypothetical protein